MSYHETSTGHIEIVDQWGHGKAPKRNWSSRPATLVVDDGDGHYTAWAFTGNRRDAAVTAARFDLRAEKIAVLSGAGVTIENPPADFWIEAAGDLQPNLTAYPDVIAY